MSAVLLTGCGSVSGFNPGIAAQVGDETVSTSTVDDTAADYCAAAEPQLQGQAVANHYLTGRVAGALTLRNAADQLLADYDVAPDASYGKAVEGATSQLSDLDADQRDALIEVQGSELYVKAAETAVGRVELGGSPSDADAQAAGEKIFLAWLDDHDVRVNPRYGVSIEQGKAVVTDTGLSFAVSDAATKSDADTPDSDYAAALPSTQRCG